MRFWREELLAIAAKHRLTVDEMTGPAHFRNIVVARKEFAIKMRTERNWSYPKIASALNRDHSTIINYFRPKIRRPV